MLKAEHITVTIQDRTLVHQCSFEVEPHDFLVIIGPNGAGKTTLIKAIMQNVASSGQVTFWGRDMRAMKAAEIARHIAVLTQQHHMAYAYSAAQVVELGRYAHIASFWKGMNETDRQAVEEAMAQVGIADLRERSVLTLSGGELQRVFLAQVLAQTPQIMILDEPANQLDIQYQLRVFDLIKGWVQAQDRAVVAVLHDLNFAFAYATKVLLMNEGRTYAYGTPEEVLTRENLLEVYKVDVCAWIQTLLARWQDK